MATGHAGIRWDIIAQTGHQTNPGCKGCRYVDDQGYCIYILHTDHRRPCESRKGGGCALKTKSSDTCYGQRALFLSGQQKKLIKTAKRKEYTILDTDAAMELYKKGSSDVQIALALGNTRGTILKWRQKNNLPSNFRTLKNKEKNHE